MKSTLRHYGIIPPNKDEVELTFFGPGYGESVVLHLPGIGWGVVDSCIFNSGDQKFVPPLEYLIFLGIEQISFIILTHPHEDHYQGMEDVIHYYLGKIDRICRYAGDGVKELKVYLENRGVTGIPGIGKLASVFGAFNEAKKHGADSRRLTARTQIIPCQRVSIDNKSFEVEVLSLSPLAEDEDSYVDILRKALPELGKSLREIPDREHNLIASAILVSVGKVKVILGSDVEKGRNVRSGWRGIVRSVDSPDLSVKTLKVAHHGSHSAYCREAWNQHCKLCKITSIVTPFNRRVQALPTEADIDRIGIHSEYVGITSHVSYLRPMEVYDRATVRRLPKKWKVVSPPKECGIIIIRYSTGGTETFRKVITPARWVKAPL